MYHKVYSPSLFSLPPSLPPRPPLCLSLPLSLPLPLCRVKYGQRNTLQQVFFPKSLEIHWLSIINSVVLVCLLLGFVMLILVSMKMLCNNTQNGLKLFI